jgi:hypothetical protein
MKKFLPSLAIKEMKFRTTFFSAAHGTFSKIDHISGHKASFSK